MLGGYCGFSKISRKGNEVVFIQSGGFDFKKMSLLASFGGGKMSIKMGKEAYVCYKCDSNPLTKTVEILDKFKKSLSESKQ